MDKESNLARYYEPVRNYLQRFASRRYSAEDLTQDTFLRACDAIQKHGPPSDPERWLFTVAKHVGVDSLRRPPYDGVAASVGELGYVPDTHERQPLDSLVAQEERGAVHDGLSKLRQEDRELLEGFYWNGRGCRKLAEETGWSYSNVKVRLHRARRRLRNSFEE